MPQFQYKARRRNGELIEGKLDVADRPAALLAIEKMGLFPVAIEVGRGGGRRARKGGAGFQWASLLPDSVRGLFRRRRRPKLTEMARFTQQLANLLHSGMPLTVALNSMTHLESKGIPPEVSRQLRQEVMEGKSLSAAMARQSHIFSDLYVSMVQAGEQSGAMEDVLRRLASHFERFAEVQSRFTSALIYPAIVAVVGIAFVTLFMTQMLPNFMKIFEEMNIPLPRATELLVGISRFISRFWWLLALVGVASFVLFHRFRKSPSGQRTLDRLQMNAPVIGKIFRLNLFGQFARTLATLLQNGVPVLTALKITEEVVPNVVLKEAIQITREEVTDGKTIAQPLARSGVFPQLMIDLLKIGEETGEVAGALQNIADTYESELSVSLGVVTNLIGPTLIIGIAILVGLLLYSVLSAMFQITSNMGQ